MTCQSRSFVSINIFRVGSMKPWQSGGCGAGQVPAPRGSKLKSCHNKSLGYWVLLYNLQFARDTTQKYFCANDRVFFKLGGYFQESQLNNVLAWSAGRWYTAAVCGTRAIIRWNDNGAKNSDYDTEGGWAGAGLGRAARMLIQPHRTQPAHLTSTCTLWNGRHNFVFCKSFSPCYGIYTYH